MQTSKIQVLVGEKWGKIMENGGSSHMITQRIIFTEGFLDCTRYQFTDLW